MNEREQVCGVNSRSRKTKNHLVPFDVLLNWNKFFAAIFFTKSKILIVHLLYQIINTSTHIPIITPPASMANPTQTLLRPSQLSLVVKNMKNMNLGANVPKQRQTTLKNIDLNSKNLKRNSIVQNNFRRNIDKSPQRIFGKCELFRYSDTQLNSKFLNQIKKSIAKKKNFHLFFLYWININHFYRILSLARI